MKKTVLLILILMCIMCGCKENRETVHGFALDTEISFTVNKDDVHIAKKAMKMCKEYEKIFSRTEKGSELYRLNSGELKEPGEQLRTVIEKGMFYSQLSGGVFDITVAPLVDLWNIKERTVPPEDGEIKAVLENVGYSQVELSPFSLSDRKIDCGAIAKGYIADEINTFFAKNGVNNVIMDLGGNVMLRGEYTVGIMNPLDTSTLFAKIKVKDKSVVTSGAYQRYFEYNGTRYHHIINAKTGGNEQNGVASVTVVANKSIDADALSTVIFLKGEEALALCENCGADAIIIKENGETVTTKNFEEKYAYEKF